MIATDTASYSDLVFGLFRLLGYRFSPRIADIADQRFWRIDPAADYGILNDLSRHRVHVNLIEQLWDDICRVAGPLTTGAVQAYDLIRMLTRNNNPTPLGRAIAEYGRIAKTLHLLAFSDPIDETYRRAVHHQFNIHESRHALARRGFHGQRGELRQTYREGQEDQLSALGLVLNAIILWNTRYINAAIGTLRAAGHHIPDEHAAALRPLARKHINMHGRYTFTTRATIELRPFNTIPAGLAEDPA